MLQPALQTLRICHLLLQPLHIYLDVLLPCKMHKICQVTWQDVNILFAVISRLSNTTGCDSHGQCATSRNVKGLAFRSSTDGFETNTAANCLSRRCLLLTYWSHVRLVWLPELVEDAHSKKNATIFIARASAAVIEQQGKRQYDAICSIIPQCCAMHMTSRICWQDAHLGSECQASP